MFFNSTSNNSFTLVESQPALLAGFCQTEGRALVESHVSLSLGVLSNHSKGKRESLITSTPGIPFPTGALRCAEVLHTAYSLA